MTGFPQPPQGDPSGGGSHDWGSHAYPKIPPPPPLPAIGPDGRPPDSIPPIVTYGVVFLVAMSAVVSTGLLVHHFWIAPRDGAAPVDALAEPAGASASPEAPSPASARAGAASGSGSAPSSAAPSSSSSSSAASAPAPPPPAPAAEATPGPEAEARDALERLREGVRVCVTGNIGVLPGTTEPVPARLSTLRGGYQAPPAVWRKPVFHCTKFSIRGPQRFQLQWQNDSATTTGRGVAWLDDDGDGKADRSLSFGARLVKRHEAELGPVELDPAPLPIKTR